MTKKGKKAQKGAIVDGVVAAAEANPSILANLSAAESAPALRNAIRKVLGKTCETNLLDNSMNLKDVAVALSQQLGNEEFTARVISLYGEKAVQAATKNQGLNEMAAEKGAVPNPGETKTADSGARGVKRALPTWEDGQSSAGLEVLGLLIMQAIISRSFAEPRLS